MKGFQRIQDYLLREDKHEYQLIQRLESTHQQNTGPKLPVHASSSVLESGSCEETHSGKYAVLRNVSGPLFKQKAPCLQGLSLDIDQQKITMLTGPVGCGKSLFLQLLLNEIPYSGSLRIGYFRSAYCSQTPWLFSGTIRCNILGSSPWDKPWYNDVLRACALDQDIQDLPEGDATQVGVRGSRISGGQQVRVVGGLHLH